MGVVYRCLIVWLVLVSSTLTAQEASKIVVKQGTMLHVRLQEQVSSDTAASGEAVRMEALADLVVDGRTIVRKGSPLAATMSVTRKTRMTPGGRLRLHIVGVEMADGEQLPLDTTETASGGGPGGKVYKGLVIASIATLSTAGATTALLWRGHDVVLPEGTEFGVQVSAERTFDQQNFELAQVADEPKPSIQSAASQLEQDPTLNIETNAGEASVRVGAKFRGEAPTKLRVKRGLYKVTVVRDGYRRWQRRVVIEGDPLTLLVPLQKK